VDDGGDAPGLAPLRPRPNAQNYRADILHVGRRERHNGCCF